MWPEAYEQEITRAWDRVSSLPSQLLETTWGRVEYATAGQGRPVLMSHGVMGGHVEALGMVETYFGTDAFAIAPSRFGYFRSTLPPGATPAIQADVYASLLDALSVETAVVIGFSAGGPSAIEFALRHADRVDLLVLASSALPRDWPVLKLFAPLMRAALSSERIFWTFKTFMPKSFRHLIGVPQDFAASAVEERTINQVGSSLLPVQPRRNGAAFDTFIGNPYVNTCPLEEIRVPTLIIHAEDDSLAPFETAARAVERVPAARLVRIHRGGHEFIGAESVVRNAIAESLASSAVISPA